MLDLKCINPGKPIDQKHQQQFNNKSSKQTYTYNIRPRRTVIHREHTLLKILVVQSLQVTCISLTLFIDSTRKRPSQQQIIMQKNLGN